MIKFITAAAAITAAACCEKRDLLSYSRTYYSFWSTVNPSDTSSTSWVVVWKRYTNFCLNNCELGYTGGKTSRGSDCAGTERPQAVHGSIIKSLQPRKLPTAPSSPSPAIGANICMRGAVISTMQPKIHPARLKSARKITVQRSASRLWLSIARPQCQPRTTSKCKQIRTRELATKCTIYTEWLFIWVIHLVVAITFRTRGRTSNGTKLDLASVHNQAGFEEVSTREFTPADSALYWICRGRCTPPYTNGWGHN